MAWRTESTAVEDAFRLLGPGVSRVHVIDYRWLERVREAALYAYRFDASLFRLLASHGAAMVCDHTVRLAPPTVVTELLAVHADASIELRVTTNLFPWWDEVIVSTLGFSGIRLANARPNFEL
jgi:hypothetical protein